MRERARRKKDEQRFCPAFRGGFPAEADVQSTLRFIKFARGGFPARGVVMGKISFVFSGQGAQFAGMGKVFYENCERARNLFNKAEEARPGTIAQCFDGSADELKMTENTQPCLYLASLAASYAMDDAGISADMTAGFSLGEISSLAYAGAYTAEEGFRIVCRRAELMAHAAAENPAYMAAVVKLRAEKIEEIASKFSRTYPVNYNSAEQTVISGDPGQLNYSASKAGLIAMTKTVAKELAARGVTCNAIAPGFVETDMTKDIAQSAPLADAIPMKRFAKPEEIAALASFLASDRAAYITGEVIRCDGGLAM